LKRGSTTEEGYKTKKNKRSKSVRKYKESPGSLKNQWDPPKRSKERLEGATFDKKEEEV
jgi:hypothetical protein